ncbi:MAG: hypothetical protein WA869_07170 [Alloacidobacterium sp.]|jgi:hypothetical protein
MQLRSFFPPCTAFVFLAFASLTLAHSQSIASADHIPDAPDAALAQQTADPNGSVQNQLHAGTDSGSLEGKQTKRILGIIPNFRAVSVDEKLPPQSVKDKFIQTTQDSFDYSAFIFAGILAGVSFAENSYPEFHQGAAGYGRYYWHTLADQAVENYCVEFIFPTALKQDSRYYTLGRGGIVKRTGYSFSRVFVTRTDSGNQTFNASEIMGAGGASAISSLYYPSRERTWTKIGQRWLINVSLDGGTFIFKEFWPDINSAIFHQKQ